MPMIAFKNKIKHGKSEENICVAFNCEYENDGFLKLKNFYPSDFDCGDYRIKIEEAIEKFDSKKQMDYENKNNGVYSLAVLNYFLDEIPSIYSIKFESETSESIYYSDEFNK